MKFWLKVVIILLLFSIFFTNSYAQSTNTYINTVSILKIGENSAWLTGSIDDAKNVNEYGFAVSNFPLPPIEGQKIEYYKMEGIPIQGYYFTYCLTDLNPGENYFVATYYKKGNSYYYADSNFFSTSRAIKIAMPEINIEISNDIINIPINFDIPVSYISGQITLKFDSDILKFKELNFNGLDDVYRKGVTSSSNGNSTFIHLGWCAENELELSDLKLNYQFQLHEDIEASGYTPVEFTEIKLINNQGDNIPVEVINGLINYQLKSQKNILSDKNFNDNDLVYLKEKIENSEYVKVTHNSQLINSRWLQAKNLFDDKLPIRIIREYSVNETKPLDGRPLYEESKFVFNHLQKEDLRNANCSLYYYSDLGVNLMFSKTSLQTLNSNSLPWEITIMPTNELELNKLQEDYNKIYSGWSIEADIESQIEIRFPIDDNVDKEKLRINAIYENGNNTIIAPYYIVDNKQEYACTIINPNALFVLIEAKEQLFTTKIGSREVINGYESYKIETASYIDNDKIMVPLELLEKCFGFQISWQSGDNKVYINDGRSVILSLDSQIVLVDLQAHFLKSRAEIKNESIYVSEEFLETILNADIDYNHITKEISIKY